MAKKLRVNVVSTTSRHFVTIGNRKPAKPRSPRSRFKEIPRAVKKCKVAKDKDEVIYF